MTTSPSRPLGVGLAALGLLTLAGCAVESAVADTPGTPAASGYADGTYTVEAGYQAPSGMERIEVVLTLADGTVTAVSVSGDAADREAAHYQSRFASAIAAEVVGRDISTLSVSRVAGASLTSDGFNAALDDIRSHAS